MSTSSLSSSPLTQYSLGPVIQTEGPSSHYSPLDSHLHSNDLSNDDSSSLPRTSSPIVNPELMGDYNGSDSSSYIGTPYSSLPILRGSSRSTSFIGDVSAHEEEEMTPNSSPMLLRPSSGRLMGGE